MTRLIGLGSGLSDLRGVAVAELFFGEAPFFFPSMEAGKLMTRLTPGSGLSDLRGVAVAELF